MKHQVYNIIPVIMVVGTDDALWPLSRKSFPKQFNKLTSGKSLLQEMVKKFSKNKILNFNNFIIVTNEDYRFIIKDQLDEISVQVSKIIMAYKNIHRLIF